VPGLKTQLEEILFGRLQTSVMGHRSSPHAKAPLWWLIDGQPFGGFAGSGMRQASLFYVAIRGSRQCSGQVWIALSADLSISYTTRRKLFYR